MSRFDRYRTVELQLLQKLMKDGAAYTSEELMAYLENNGRKISRSTFYVYIWNLRWKLDDGRKLVSEISPFHYLAERVQYRLVGPDEVVKEYKKYTREKRVFADLFMTRGRKR